MPNEKTLTHILASCAHSPVSSTARHAAQRAGTRRSCGTPRHTSARSWPRSRRCACMAEFNRFTLHSTTQGARSRPLPSHRTASCSPRADATVRWCVCIGRLMDAGLVCVSSIPFFPKDDGDRILQQRKVESTCHHCRCPWMDAGGQAGGGPDRGGGAEGAAEGLQSQAAQTCRARCQKVPGAPGGVLPAPMPAVTAALQAPPPPPEPRAMSSSKSAALITRQSGRS